MNHHHPLFDDDLDDDNRSKIRAEVEQLVRETNNDKIELLENVESDLLLKAKQEYPEQTQKETYDDLILAKREQAINERVSTSFVHMDVEGGFVCIHQSFLFKPGTNDILQVSESSCFVPYSSDGQQPPQQEKEEVKQPKSKPFISNAQLEVMRLEGKA